jgi:hypothetical protein
VRSASACDNKSRPQSKAAEQRFARAWERKQDTKPHEIRLRELRERAFKVESSGVVSVNKMIATMRSLFKFCEQRGYLLSNAAELAT